MRNGKYARGHRRRGAVRTLNGVWQSALKASECEVALCGVEEERKALGMTRWVHCDALGANRLRDGSEYVIECIIARRLTLIPCRSLDCAPLYATFSKRGVAN